MNEELQKQIIDLKNFRASKSLTKLNQAGVERVEDLFWILPLHFQKTPEVSLFESGNINELFMGIGKIIDFNSYPNRKVRGKGGTLLQNITATVKDFYSESYMTLKWFNTYPSQASKLQKATFIQFEGVLQNFRGTLQVLNPKFDELLEETIPLEIGPSSENPGIKIQYPTINGVDSRNIQRIISKLPSEIWDVEEYIPDKILEERKLLSLKASLKVLHGLCPEALSPEERQKAKNRLVYEEFLREQVKILARRNVVKESNAPIIKISKDSLSSYISHFPYELTIDQSQSIEDIKKDFTSTQPMMRMIQGDVGCGKTTVAAIAAMGVLESGYQVAFMCPTESLALQHFESLAQIMTSLGYKTELLTGSLTPKEKLNIQENLKNGSIDFIIGTHALFQDSVNFKKLGLAIIDEQHKFGVDQRLKLVNKGTGTHCLTMTATPIPRSLSLTQYGDLDLSIIKTMPLGRKGIKTRIVNPENFENFLTFVNTRISMKEQVYIVVPAITDNPDMDMVNLESVHAKFLEIFPNHRILALHGQLNNEDKIDAFQKFTNHEVDILISTSVIEVGINVPNSTVMAVMNPDRFGLSSLHQLRGRVGRGEKPGFCFLVNDKKISKDSSSRLEIMEKTNDGFVIAEEDLKNRGQGNIFGKEQSGSEEFRKVANIVEHQKVLFAVKEDIEKFKSENTDIIEYLTKIVCEDQRVFSTI
ncbi:MAG: ATP-dependent DNA helicase RecG [Bacteriovoracaceae bacterium]|nr:ATP-dependent DNA helicase RecG [Bacteriovoracaceae bacterium]